MGDALSGESCSWQKPETDEQTLWIMTWRTQDGHSRLRSNGSGTKEKRSPTAYTTFHTKSDRSSVATHQKHRQKRCGASLSVPQAPEAESSGGCHRDAVDADRASTRSGDLPGPRQPNKQQRGQADRAEAEERKNQQIGTGKGVKGARATAALIDKWLPPESQQQRVNQPTGERSPRQVPGTNAAASAQAGCNPNTRPS